MTVFNDENMAIFLNLHRRNPALWQRKRAQRCNSSGSDSAEVTMCTSV